VRRGAGEKPGERGCYAPAHGRSRDLGVVGLRGPTTEWYPDGNKAFTGFYDRDQRTGRWTWWAEDGSRIKTGEYVADREEGRWEEFYPGGKPKSERSFRRGRSHGRWIEWYPDGKKRLEGSVPGRLARGPLPAVGDRRYQDHRLDPGSGRRLRLPPVARAPAGRPVSSTRR
jgi:antitoxin component YwqK of YwqJK toxin-antitoxin module